jgi:hypothetical protein
MLVLLPAIFFFMSCVVINRYFKTGWRISSLISAVMAATIITFMTEVLSLFHSFSFYPVASAWVVLTVISTWLALPVLKLSFKERLWSPDKLLFDEQFLWYLAAVALVITGITAVVSTPNTWDSLSYHLSRVEHWIQDKTISYYPTHIIRQLYYCPWAEFAIAHLRLLCPWKGVVNLLQWFAMAGSLVCVSLIVKQLGGSRRAQLVACVAAVMLPMGILQSVSTQTDYVETFWLMCFVFFVKEILVNFRPLYVFSAGLSLGLALLTKGYGYILMVPFLILLIVSISDQSKRIKTISVITLCVIALNIGYYVRNQSAFGSVTLPKDKLVTSSWDYKVPVGNLLRNFAVEMDTPFQKFDKLLPDGLAKISGWLGINFVYDPHASMNPVFYQDFRGSECYCGNFLHTVLFTLIILLCWLMPRQSRGLFVYMLLICCAGILFCLFVRFQYWVTRFHLPLFIMFCPVFGIFMDRLLSPRKIILLGALFFLNAFLFLFFNPFHPWFGTNNIWHYSKNGPYFISIPVMSRPVVTRDYITAIEQIRMSGCREIGIISGSDFWEYPIWVIMREQSSNNHFRIEHINVNNDSARIPYPLGDFYPCTVVVAKKESEGIALDHKQYRKIWGSRNPADLIDAVYVPVH